MKKIVFVCLLSLSMCLSESTTKPEAHPAQQAVNPETKPAPAPPKPEQAHNETVTIVTTPPAPHETVTKPQETKDKDNKTAPIDNKTGNKEPEKKEEKPTEKSPKNDVKPEPAKEVIPAKETVPAKEAVPKEGGAKNETSTVHPVPAKTTEVPKAVTEKPFVQARGFDGASFIGGIILTLGLLAIGFMGFKYYKNQTERNYHTL